MSSDPIAPPVVETLERRAFHERNSRQNLSPLWLSLAKLVTHDVAEDAVLFSFSDRPVQEVLHLFREERRDA